MLLPAVATQNSNSNSSNITLVESQLAPQNTTKRPKQARNTRKNVKRLSTTEIPVPSDAAPLSLSRLSKSISITAGDKTILKCSNCYAICSNKSGFARHKCFSRRKETSIIAFSTLLRFRYLLFLLLCSS